MPIAEILTIITSLLLIFNEIRNIQKYQILEEFIHEVHIVRDRLDILEEILIKKYKE